MQPDNSTPSQQGTGTKTPKTGKTIDREDIPDDLLKLQDKDEGVTEGALPPTSGEPNTTGVSEKGRRNLDRGMHS